MRNEIECRLTFIHRVVTQASPAPSHSPITPSRRMRSYTDIREQRKRNNIGIKSEADPSDNHKATSDNEIENGIRERFPTMISENLSKTDVRTWFQD